MLNADIDPTPQRVADAYLHHQTQTATVSEWVEAIITPSVRRTTTKDNYRVMCRSLEAFHPHITLGELSHDALERWQNWMRNERHLCQNTISNRLKTLRCLVTEAIKRDVIRADHDPFRHIRIPEITARHEHLTEHELTRLEQTTLPSHQLRHVRDAFLFCCYTGLRWSDFRSLTTAHLSPTAAGPDILLRQHKTGTPLRIPLAHLWQGKPLAILHRYGTLEHLVDIGDNKTANQLLRQAASASGITKRLHWHMARHTCATLLNQHGLRMQEIQYILGHSKQETTARHYAETLYDQVAASLTSAFP